MANYIDKFVHIQPTAPVQRTPEPTAVMAPTAMPTAQVQPLGSNILEKYLHNKGISAVTQINQTTSTQEINYKNNLRSRFKNNDAKIMGIIIRSFGAENKTGNELLREGDIRGNFNNAIKRLDEMKELGINTLHVLPIHPPGKQNAMGTAGSVYAPADFLKVDPALDDPNDPKNVREEFKNFINECHKRGISVMLDLPSCASYDLFLEHPEWMAFEKDGTPKTPGGWNDIRMMNPWEDETKGILNKDLLNMHKEFVDMCIDLGVDGVRSDVSRTKPTQFWDNLITYSRQRDPEFAWLAESYTYEDASPQLNMNYDRPQDALRAGFDSYYASWSDFKNIKTKEEFDNKINKNLEVLKRNKGKSNISSFATHDQQSPILRGLNYWNMVLWLNATLQSNMYFLDGFSVGDDYTYSYEGKHADKTYTDDEYYFVHSGMFDIFNFTAQVKAKYPRLKPKYLKAIDFRIRNQELIQQAFIELLSPFQ